MQKIATKVFIVASLAFGVFGILLILVAPNGDSHLTGFAKLDQKLLQISVFVILPSFALSVSSKYLNPKS